MRLLITCLFIVVMAGCAGAPDPSRAKASTKSDTIETKEVSKSLPLVKGDVPKSDLPTALAPVSAVPTKQPAKDGPKIDLVKKSTSKKLAKPAEPGYTTVKVFYGTDRKPRDEIVLEAAGVRFSFIGALVCGAATALFGAFALWQPARTTQLLFAACLGASVTLALFGWIYQRVRAGIDRPEDGIVYSNERGDLQYGTCEVTIPADHKPGRFETPPIYVIHSKYDPARYILLKNVTRLAADEFFADLRDRVQGSTSKDAFVFFHGFNVSFEEAARRTAQLAYDLKFPGAPIFFSWPSRGELLDYHVDENNAEWAIPDVRQFLAEVAEQTGADHVHLIAHSMGNRALTNGLVALAASSPTTRFRNLILTAPDIDVGVFQRVIYPAIVNCADRVTLYASSRDWALKESQRRHFYPRVGDSGNGLVILPRMDTIDVTAVDTSFLGHSYYGSSDSVIDDMTELINQHRPPEARQKLELKHRGKDPYWLFPGK